MTEDNKGEWLKTAPIRTINPKVCPHLILCRRTTARTGRAGAMIRRKRSCGRGATSGV